ncbi:type II toxin-antitoxin system VapC family toxin [Halovivax sp.]|uniref:type II toxin-antitoxin system VapC family toxin n=1 Tax=Halovivax sp. TaxID=1935978 RepID=UPI0025BC80B8|nr:PIN domain-containing protein [Halovivax sp.]
MKTKSTRRSTVPNSNELVHRHGVFYAHQDESAPRHEVALEALATASAGSDGRLFTSEYVYDEAVTLVRQRRGRFNDAKRTGDRIRGIDPFPSAFEMLFVTESVFEETQEIFERYDDQSLSFTDASTIALIERSDVDAVLSFDDGFDGIVERVDPASV